MSGPAKKYRPTGCCGTCGFRFRLRKDRTLQTHYLYSGRETNATPCPGSGQPDKWAAHNARVRASAQAPRQGGGYQ